MINLFKKYHQLFLSTIFFALFSFSVTLFAAPFAPGATLDPGCVPGSSSDCTVAPVAMGSSITSATAGSLLFAGTAGIMAQDNANLFWDNDNNRLGIGTATPGASESTGAKLHVVETTAGQQGIVLSVNFTGTNPTNTGGMMLRNTGGVNTYSGMLFGDDSGTAVAGVGAQIIDTTNNYGELSFQTRNSAGYSERLRVTQGGNIGIGTTTPAGLLQVSQSTTGPGTVSVSGTAVTGVGTNFTNTFKVGDSIIVTTTSGSETKAIATITSDTVLVTAAFTGTAVAGTAYTLTGGNRFAVLGNGRVGIGTITPSSALNLSGDATTMALIDTYNDNASTNTSHVWLRRAGGTAALPTSVLTNWLMGTYGFNGYADGAFISTASARMSALTTENWSATAYGTRLKFEVTPKGSIVKVTGLHISDNGNVMVGMDPNSGTATTGLLQVKQSTTGLGTVATNGSTTLTGTNTFFTDTFKVGDTITVSGETIRTIDTIASDTSLTVTVAFSTTASGLSYTLTGGNRFAVLGNGDVGIGTTTPIGSLNISRDGGFSSSLYMDTYNDAASASSKIFFRQAGGTASSPTSILAGKALGFIGFSGYADGAFPGSNSASIQVISTENWSATGRGARLTFAVVPKGSLTAVSPINISDNGNIMFGTNPNSSTASKGLIQVKQPTAGFGTVSNTAGGSTITGTNGTQFTDTFKVGDTITVNGETVAISVITSDTDMTTAAPIVGANSAVAYTITGGSRFIVLGNGNVGIGTITPLKALQVIGDVRIGTSGSNGCLEGFDGTLITGTCASDERLKKDIVPLSGILDKITQLTPSSYYYRSDEFPGLQLAISQQFGLVAQDAERVFPELVADNVRGEYKGVKYQLLPIYLLEAIKELNLKVNNISGLTATSGSGSVVDQLVGAIVNMKELIVEKLTIGSSEKPTTITVYDKNGNAGCMTVEDVNTGATKIIPGVCADTAPVVSDPAPVTPVPADPVLVEPVSADSAPADPAPLELIPDVIVPEVTPEPAVESTPVLDPEPVIDTPPADTTTVPADTTTTP